MGKGGATVDTQAEVIIIEQGEAGAREHTGVTWDQRSDGRGGGGATVEPHACLWIYLFKTDLARLPA